MDELVRFLQEAGASRLPAGQRLEITVTNVDMAGDIELWRGAGRCDLRVMRDVYPPRIDLWFTLTGADRGEIRTGSRQLKDMNYLTHAAPVTSDQLRYEKALLRDWLQKELRQAAGS